MVKAGTFFARNKKGVVVAEKKQGPDQKQEVEQTTVQDFSYSHSELSSQQQSGGSENSWCSQIVAPTSRSQARASTIETTSILDFESD